MIIANWAVGVLHSISGCFRKFHVGHGSKYHAGTFHLGWQKFKNFGNCCILTVQIHQHLRVAQLKCLIKMRLQVSTLECGWSVGYFSPFRGTSKKNRVTKFDGNLHRNRNFVHWPGKPRNVVDMAGCWIWSKKKAAGRPTIQFIAGRLSIEVRCSLGSYPTLPSGHLYSIVYHQPSQLPKLLKFLVQRSVAVDLSLIPYLLDRDRRMYTFHSTWGACWMRLWT